jgi:hypothetical protein
VKSEYFNIGFVSCSVNIQPDIMQNYLKNMQENHKFFEITLRIFFEFFLYYYYYYIGPNPVALVGSGPTNPFFSGLDLDQPL